MRRLSGLALPQLAFETVSLGAAPTRTAWFLHGLLGQGRNWRSFAKRLLEHPGVDSQAWRLLLVDLRCHGGSASLFGGPHTIASAAADLARLATTVGAPDLVVGHSLGGKVALAFAELSAAPTRTWALDSMPGRVEGDPHGVRSILAAVADLPPVLPSREGLQQALRTRVSPAIAAWLASSLVPAVPGGPLAGPLRFHFAFQDALQLYEDYRVRDCWEVVQKPPPGADVRLLCAGRSAGWSSPAVAGALAGLASRVHVIPDAGHWLHSTHPGEVAALLAEHAMWT